MPHPPPPKSNLNLIYNFTGKHRVDGHVKITTQGHSRKIECGDYMRQMTRYLQMNGKKKNRRGTIRD